MNKEQKARLFDSLHVPGDPLILFNVWDPGSAKAVTAAGAKAIATGSASVAAAFGFEDGEGLPLALALDNAARIAAAVELPVTIDFEGGYAEAPDAVAANLAKLCETGAIGCNFEDRIVGGEGLHPIALQAQRIRAIRGAAGPDFFINARTDIFLASKAESHDEAKADAVLERAAAYAEAGASGLFVPGLADLSLLARICGKSPLPVNVMTFPGAPSTTSLAEAGAARISHGPFPHIQAMKALTQAALGVYRA